LTHKLAFSIFQPWESKFLSLHYITITKMCMAAFQRKIIMGLRPVIILIIIFWAGAVFSGELPAQDDKGQEQVQTQMKVLQSLNQIAVSLTHIITYNDKVVLDQEYNTIINNLNLSKIPDVDIITLLQELMDLLTSSKIQDHDRAFLSRSFEKNVQNELKKRVRSRIFETDLIINPYTTVLNAVLNAGSFYFNYRSQMEDYKREKEEKAWAIETKTLQGLNNFYKKLLKYSWDLMRRYNFPDEWRLDEKQLSNYTAILKEPNLELRYRKLERIENSFQKFPPYWYYRGQAAQEIGKKEEALRCFNEFQDIHQSILRKDPYAASTAMCKTMLMAEQAVPDNLKSDLEVILANSDDADWGNILFAALQYARLGDADTAGRLILRNLDNGHIAFIENPDMIRTVGPALLLNARPDVFTRIMDTVLENDKVKNYDVLWLYGQIRNRDILKRLEPEFDHVLLLTANKSLLNPLNMFKGDNLTLFLPTRWMADNLAVTLRLTNEAGEHGFHPAEMAPMPDFPEITVLIFKNVLSINTFIKKKRSAQIAIALVREKLSSDKTGKEAYDIEMLFTSKILPSEEQLSKIITYSKYLFPDPAGAKPKPSEKRAAAAGPDAEKNKANKKKEDPDDYALWFTKEKIVVNAETFQWSDNGVIF
jgi:tetratricopeptide (TPR) repeat protein